ncbi:MAG: hypothetical protein FI707_10450 [SAR202 cluster bacterium]|nr:hypothetical protein [SAR202 cluster bacterium]MDP6665063.1 hypothetical protein [SAR202 cluster bacterium]MDP6799897.1 hypothetical protein [SAR202 cluster bacterium]MQG58146.1 hypothetical protein [SAR202 cluster bacterium]MQG69197.1 hypothetical protein [SAR202 cluster bacterium]
MSANKTRFTLDMDPMFQKRLKVIAALKGVSMRQYCLSAVSQALDKDEAIDEERPRFNEETLDRLFALRDKIFEGRKLPGDSADLLREAREIRARELG